MAVKPVTVDGKRQVTRLIEEIGYRHSRWDAFSDWVEMMAISISNSCDKVHYEEREKRYMDIVKKYTKAELEKFAEAYACLVNTMEYEISMGNLRDILGETFHELELHNKYKGQFFTPFTVCEMMGRITIGDNPQLNEKGYITICEPCSGSGAMVLGAAQSAKDQKIDYQKQFVVLANDIDLKCVHMCYVQLSLYGIPAVVQHGDSLILKTWSRWYTPIYILDDWIWRDKMTFTSGRNQDDEKIKCWLQPMYYLMVYGMKDSNNKIQEEQRTHFMFFFNFDKEEVV